MKIINVVGARPNLMKIAPLMEAYKAHPSIEPILVHTGQHYDRDMSRLFFEELGIPKPHINLGVGSASHAVQTAQIITAFEPVVLDHRPDAVLVVGDVNSTVACGLVAVKLGVKLVHVEAGLRSFDRTMPEEINRLLTDTISDLLFCTEPSGVANLEREGIPPERIHLVGNVMIDTLLNNQQKAQSSSILQDLSLIPGNYAVLTLHRPSNADDPAAFSRILDALEIIQNDLPVIFPVHPRTRKNMDGSDLAHRIEMMPNLRLTAPAGYLDFLKLMTSAKLVMTDSGGIQEETTILKVPCLTLRANTERPITLELGTNRLVGTDPDAIVTACREIQAGNWPTGQTPELWDGKASQRIARILQEKL